MQDVVQLLGSFVAHAWAPSEEFARPENFNAVSMLAPGETRLSGVFRWLLDDAGSHGQRALFRDRFVGGLLREPIGDWAGARVGCEIATADGSGRMDLVMESSDGTRCVVIENKPWASWRPNQLARYMRDQTVLRERVRVHALVGGPDVHGALARHWDSECLTAPPEGVDASGYDAVVSWLEGCAGELVEGKLRWFVLDLADYCRTAVLGGATVEDLDEAADLICAGGCAALDAAGMIAKALPLARTRHIAALVGGQSELVGTTPSIALESGDARVNFVLFGSMGPWAGAVTADLAARLKGDLPWSSPERLWPRWVWLKRLGEPGASLCQAVARFDADGIARSLPIVAEVMVGRNGAAAAPPTDEAR